jgi:hypothetical protein
MIPTEMVRFFANLSFSTPRATVSPDNPLQVLLRHSSSLWLQKLSGLNIPRAVLEILPQKEQDLIEALLRGETQKAQAVKYGVTQGSISSRIQKAFRRIQFYMNFPQPTEEDYQELGKHFPSTDVDTARWIIATSCQMKTVELLTKKYQRRFTQVTVRYHWKRMLLKLESIPQLGRLREAMNMMDKNFYILHEVKFPQTWKKKTHEPS